MAARGDRRRPRWRRSSGRCASRSPGSSTARRGVALDGHGLPLPVRAAAPGSSSASLEQRRFGGLPRRDGPAGGARRASSSPATCMFWHHAIEAVGAGLATVLGNLQVLVVGFVAWLVFGERPSRSDAASRCRRPGRRRPDLGRHRRRRVRREPGARRRARHRHGVLLRRLPARDPAGRPRPAPAGRSGRDRDGIDGASSRRWSGSSSAISTSSPAVASLGWLALLGLTSQSARLPADLAVAAAAAGGRDLDHPAVQPVDDRRPGDRPAGRGAVAGPARRASALVDRRDRRRRRSRSAGIRDRLRAAPAT